MFRTKRPPSLLSVSVEGGRDADALDQLTTLCVTGSTCSGHVGLLRTRLIVYRKADSVLRLVDVTLGYASSPG